MAEPITIILVDDHEVVRKGVRAYLETLPDFRVVGEASSGEEAIVLVSELIPDLVLMDQHIHVRLMRLVEELIFMTQSQLKEWKY